MAVKKIIKGEQIFVKAGKAQKSDLKLAQDLQETLLANRDQAIGLAANMIGASKRIIAIMVGPIAIVMLNPLIKAKEQPYLTEEGCLSLNGARMVQRFKKITVEYYDSNYQLKSQNFDGIAAEAIQHEIDHTEGKII